MGGRFQVEKKKKKEEKKKKKKETKSRQVGIANSRHTCDCITCA